MSERLVQYEFKVIVQASEDAWPNEVRYQLFDVLDRLTSRPVAKVVSVERISDY